MTIIEMRVDMDCGGCENKVKSALQTLKGVEEVSIDMALQKVTVTVKEWTDQKKILKTVRRTGRRAELWHLPCYPHHNYSYNQHLHNYYPPRPHSSSSYNYYKHGYDSARYHPHALYTHSSIFTHHPTPPASAFSDDNPHACSIM